MRLAGVMLSALMLALSAPVGALMLDEQGRVHLHGYVGQGLVYSPDNPFGGFESQQRPSLDYREIGLNLSALLNDSLRLTVQGRSRRMAEVEDGSPTLEILSINWVLAQAPWGMVELRLGRNKNNLIGFYSAQDAPSSHPGVVLPLNYVLLPPSLLAMDGAALDVSHLGEDGTEVNLTLYGGERRDLISRTMEIHTYGQTVPGDFDYFGLWGMKLMVRPGAVPALTAGFSVARAEQGFSSPLPARSWQVGAWGFNGMLRWQQGPWQLTLDALRINNDRSRADQPRGFYDLGYLELTRQLGARSLLLLRRSWYEARRNPLRNSPWIHTSEAWTAGARYYLTDRWHLAAQLSHVRGTAMVPAFENYEREPLRKYWMLYMMELTFEF